MTKPKVAKPANSVSSRDVRKHQKSLNKLQRQLTAANRRNTRNYNTLLAQQEEAQDTATEQLSIVQQAAVKQAAAAEETPEEQTQSANVLSAITSQAQTDETYSKAYGDAYATRQKDAMKRRALVNALIRNGQIT